MSLLISMLHRLKTTNVVTQMSRYKSTYCPRRAVMYVPGDDKKKIQKSMQLNVDTIALDCEDGVSITQKSNARQTIRSFFDQEYSTICGQTHTEWSVRVNGIGSGLLEEDLKVVMGSAKIPKTILLPKVETTEDIKYFSNELLKSTEIKAPIKLIFFMESCRSLLNLANICQCATTEFKHIFEPVAIVFGSDDYCASLGATRSENSQEILYARQKMVSVAKAFDLQAIDMVYIKFKDDEGLKKQSEAGATMGYTGKQIIHPNQIDIVEKAFLPSDNKIAWATDLVKAFNEHKQIGKGAFVYHNQMIDMPTVKQAFNIINLHEQVNKRRTN